MKSSRSIFEINHFEINPFAINYLEMVTRFISDETCEKRKKYGVIVRVCSLLWDCDVSSMQLAD